MHNQFCTDLYGIVIEMHSYGTLLFTNKVVSIQELDFEGSVCIQLYDIVDRSEQFLRKSQHCLRQ